ncbi:Uncharacterised protein [Yersinia bercovieri]|nr:Uncharacterised protein [Yersinia bercovieri]CNF22103.1 Uncharacterised protein [Yersinia bercovieri]
MPSQLDKHECLLKESLKISAISSHVNVTDEIAIRRAELAVVDFSIYNWHCLTNAVT